MNRYERIVTACALLGELLVGAIMWLTFLGMIYGLFKDL